MWPSYMYVPVKRYMLPEYDVAGIQSIYGKIMNRSEYVFVAKILLDYRLLLRLSLSIVTIHLNPHLILTYYGTTWI